MFVAEDADADADADVDAPSAERLESERATPSPSCWAADVVGGSALGWEGAEAEAFGASMRSCHASLVACKPSWSSDMSSTRLVQGAFCAAEALETADTTVVAAAAVAVAVGAGGRPFETRWPATTADDADIGFAAVVAASVDVALALGAGRGRGTTHRGTDDDCAVVDDSLYGPVMTEEPGAALPAAAGAMESGLICNRAVLLVPAAADDAAADLAVDDVIVAASAV